MNGKNVMKRSYRKMTKLINILKEIKVKSPVTFQIAANEDEAEKMYNQSPDGVSLVGYIIPKKSYNDIAKVLGQDAGYNSEESYDDGGPKVSAEWTMKLNNGNLMRIYDYKEPISLAVERDRPIIWHVGGKLKDIQEVMDALGLDFTTDFSQAYNFLELNESFIFEISKKVIDDRFKAYEKQVVNLDYDIVKYYVERFDQIKNGLKDRVQRKDELVLRLLPKELKTEEALEKLYYLNIYKWDKFRDLERLIDGAFSKAQAKKKEEELVNSVETDADLIYSKDGIEIYRGDAEQKCIKYGKDGYYAWCISRPQGSMYGTYRFSGGESRMFYFVFDRSKPDTKQNNRFIDPYHAIVIHRFENGTWALTSALNDGDRKYKTYQELLAALPEDLANALKDKENLFPYSPPSKEEIEVQALAGKQLTPDQFAELSYATKKLYVRTNASNYQKLPSEIFNLLDLDLKNEAINNNRKVTFDEVKSNLGLIKRYADYRFTRFPNEPLPYEFLPYLKPPLQQDYYEKFEEDYLSFDEIEKYFPESVVKQYIQKQIDNLDFLPKEAVKYMTPEQKAIFNVYSIAFKDLEYASSGAQGGRIAPARSVRIFNLSTPSFKKLSDQERAELINLSKEVLTNPSNQLKYYAISLGVPTAFEQNGKLYFITPDKNKSNVTTFSIVDENGNTVKSDIKQYSFTKDGKRKMPDTNLGYTGSTSFYLKPGIDYDGIILDDQNFKELPLQESLEFRRFKKLAGLL